MFASTQITMNAFGSHRFVRSLILLCMGLIISSPARAQSAIELGINLESANDWSRSLMFADAMKQARPWGKVSNLTDTSVSIDGDGWPTQDAGVIIISPVDSAPPAPYVPGAFKLSFTGREAVSAVGSPGVS